VCYSLWYNAPTMLPAGKPGSGVPVIVASNWLSILFVSMMQVKQISKKFNTFYVLQIHLFVLY
jgi:hypothetical protein